MAGAEWLTLSSVARRVDVSYRTVQRWAADGRLPTVRRGGHRWTRTDWLDEFLLFGECFTGLFVADEHQDVPLVTRRRRRRWRPLLDALFALGAVAAGYMIDEVWCCDWHPGGVDVDRASAITAAALVSISASALMRRRP